MRPVQLAPSILSADFSRLGEQIRAVEPYAGRIHVDVMDGHFVPNLSMGPVVVRSIRPITALPIEVHLMVTNPENFVEAFATAGADRLVFHIEVVEDPAALAKRIRTLGVSAGLAVNPETLWDGVEPHLGEIDLAILMTVNPGFGAQAFLDHVLPKVQKARSRLTQMGVDVDIEVDGGIGLQTASKAKEEGANVFVAGNAIFSSPGGKNPASAARELARLVGAQ
ncbi:MAG: ribulose-phosphate 3-epimerase [Acidimicrobiia bacterium]